MRPPNVRHQGRNNRHEPKDDKIKVKPNLVWQLLLATGIEMDMTGPSRTHTHTQDIWSWPTHTHTELANCFSLASAACHCWRFNRINPAAERAEKKSYKLVGSWIESSCSCSCSGPCSCGFFGPGQWDFRLMGLLLRSSISIWQANLRNNIKVVCLFSYLSLPIWTAWVGKRNHFRLIPVSQSNRKMKIRGRSYYLTFAYFSRLVWGRGKYAMLKLETKYFINLD